MSKVAPLTRRNGEVRPIDDLSELESLLSKDYDMSGWWKVSDEIYHGSSPISRSSLIQYRLSPANYKLKYTSTNERSLIVGRAFHDRFSLNSKAWSSSWHVSPAFDKRTKAGKAEWKIFLEDKDPSQILTQDEFDMIGAMHANVKSDHELRDLLDEDVEFELACFMKTDNVWTKAKLDGWRAVDRTIVELKSTICNSVEDFKRSFFNYHYDVQAAFYWDHLVNAVGVTPHRYICLGFEKKPPYKVYKLELQDEVLALGRARYQPLLEQHKICTFENSWPSNYGLQILVPPVYLLNQFNISI